MICFLILNLIFALNKYGEYHFYRNTGGLFYDYSEKGFHAFNGQLLESDQKDTYLTDRGAYFDGSTYITIHNDKWDYPNMQSKVKIGIWIYLLDFGGILYRKSENTGLVFQVTALESQNIDLVVRSCDTATLTTCSVNSYVTSKSLWNIQEWYLLWIKFVSHNETFKVYRRDIIDNFSNSGNVYYQEPSEYFQTFLGLNESQEYMKGFVYLLVISKNNGRSVYQDLDNTNCNNNCYFGNNDSYCQCNDCVQIPQELCLSNQQNPLLASDGTTCTRCSGICRAQSQCFECPQQQSPVCDVYQQISYQDVCYQKCSGCQGPEQTECLSCKNTFNKNPSTKICECPQLAIESTLECLCQQGYTMVYQNSLYECKECEYPCKTCLNTPDFCVSCSILSAQPQNGECKCSQGFIWDEEECVCQEGFYNSCKGCSFLDCQECYQTCKSCSGGTKYDCLSCLDHSILLESGECVLCDQSCKTCKGSLQNDCLSCFDYFVLTQQGTCQECEQKHFSEDNQCVPCKEDCFLCDSKMCLKCIQEDEVSDGEGGCNMGCLDGQFEQNRKCYDCRSTCRKCSSYEECFECVQFAHFIDNSCKCFDYYSQTEEGCVLQDVRIEIDFVQENIFIIEFDIELKFDLKMEDLSVSIQGGYEFDYLLKKINSTDYYFYLLASESIPKNTSLSIQLSENVQGKGGNSLNTYTLQTSLEKTKKNNLFQAFLKNSAENSSEGTILFLGILSFIGGNPTAMWTFINTVQILSLLPLSTLYLSTNSQILLISLSNYKPFPNIFQVFFERSGNTPYKQAKEFGLQTNDFLINSGELMMVLFSALTLNIILRLVINTNMLLHQWNFRTRLRKMKNSMLIRVWIQEYYQILILASIQCMDPNINNMFGVINLIISILIILIGILTPLFLFLLLIKFPREILSQNRWGFHSKLGILFNQFKNTSILHTQYYLVFIFRRFINVLILVFLLQYFWVQIFVFLISSFLQTVYVLYFRPFKNRTDLFLNIVAEFFTFFVHVAVLFYQWEGFIEEEYLDYCVMTCVSFIILGNILCPLYSVFYQYSSLFCVVKNELKNKYQGMFQTFDATSN